MNARQFCRHRAERPAIFNGRVNFRIERFLRGKTAWQINLNDRPRGRLLARAGFGRGARLGRDRLQLQPIAQRQTQRAEESDVKEIAPASQQPVLGAATKTTVF